MDTLETLIKLQQQELDAQRHNLRVVEDKRAELEGDIATMQQQLAEESAYADGNPDASMALPNFRTAVSMQQSNKEKAIAGLEGEAERIREIMRLKFAEIKRLELLQEARAKRKREQVEWKEQQELDEMMLQQHHRQQQDDTGDD